MWYNKMMYKDIDLGISKYKLIDIEIRYTIYQFSYITDEQPRRMYVR